MASCSQGTSRWMYIVNHVFLPPKLPQEDDINAVLDKHLIEETLAGLRIFKTLWGADSNSDNQKRAIDSASDGVMNMLCVHRFGTAGGDETLGMRELETALKDVCESGSNRFIPVKVAAQNAGLLIYRQKSSLRVEMFELSPQTYAVTGTQGRLCRTFPGIALHIPLSKIEPAFLKTLARTLERMSEQVVPAALPSSKKAGQSHEETRDTASPKMATELLTAFMLPLGDAVDVASIQKHTRDEVLWENAKLPWRRSSTWLLLKVSIQLVFLRSGLNGQEAQSLYKHFMVHFAALLLSKITPILKNDTSCAEWSEIVYIMRAKIARRLLKLETPLAKQIQQRVRAAMAGDVLQQAWCDIQQAEANETRIDTTALETLDFETDTFASLPQLDEFIAGISKRPGNTMTGTFTPRCLLPEANTLEEWVPATRSHSAFQIGWRAFQTGWWDTMLSSVDEWLVTNLQSLSFDADGSCTTLWNGMKQYQVGIQGTSADNPEALSLMVLVEMELWAALDKLACKECPMLLEYDPDVRTERLQCLLLPHRGHMERLYAVEVYIANRKKRGTKKDMWTSFARRDTFAVRYFDQSHEHQSLRHRIEEKATQDRKSKGEEFTRLKARYKQLMDEYAAEECDVSTEVHNGKSYEFHPRRCRRCQKSKEAERLEITVNEWPLPANELALKAVVFELRVPKWFAVWRQATGFIRFHILRFSYSSVEFPALASRYTLETCPHLSSYFIPQGPAFESPYRIGLLSKEKSHVQTHYKPKRISTLFSVQEILYANGRRYRYYDNVTQCFITKLSATEGRHEIARTTTYRLPSTSASIQKFIHKPDHGCDGPLPNTVVATQSDCPAHLTLTEYKALCSIPLGHSIQWQNVLLQVTAPAVDFKKTETVMVVLQAIYQAGPRVGSDWHRDCHHIPATSERFSRKMLESLRSATDKIEDNWKCVDELACYIAIARRILSLTDSDTLKRDVLAYLCTARGVALHWVKALKARVDDAVDDEKQHFRSKVAHAALVCADSFNFEDSLTAGESILALALQSPSDMADFIECCITIQECYSTGSDNALVSRFHWRWQQLCVRANDTLYRAIVEQGSIALDTAIQRSWVAFSPLGAGWATSPVPGSPHNTTWLVGESGSPGGETLTVHYCLLTGEMRVNGLPLSRPPAEYEAHSTYSTLFGTAVLEVMPCDVPGMLFSSRKRYAEHEIFFGLSGNGDLNVKAVKDGRAMEFVDPARLSGLPRRLVLDFVHWYDMASNTVEFRSKQTPWATSDAD